MYKIAFAVLLCALSYGVTAEYSATLHLSSSSDHPSITDHFKSFLNNAFALFDRRAAEKTAETHNASTETIDEAPVTEAPPVSEEVPSPEPTPEETQEEQKPEEPVSTPEEKSDDSTVAEKDKNEGGHSFWLVRYLPFFGSRIWSFSRVNLDGNKSENKSEEEQKKVEDEPSTDKTVETEPKDDAVIETPENKTEENKTEENKTEEDKTETPEEKPEENSGPKEYTSWFSRYLPCFCTYGDSAENEHNTVGRFPATFSRIFRFSSPSSETKTSEEAKPEEEQKSEETKPEETTPENEETKPEEETEAPKEDVPITQDIPETVENKTQENNGDDEVKTAASPENNTQESKKEEETATENEEKIQEKKDSSESNDSSDSVERPFFFNPFMSFPGNLYGLLSRSFRY